MKRIVVLSACMFLLLLTGCASKPTKLEELQSQIVADNKMIGVAYLGGGDTDMESAKETFAADYFEFIQDIDQCVEVEGYQYYVIVPASEDVLITVFECAYDDDFLPYGERKLLSSSKPILIKGNISDILPNILIVAENGIDVVTYCPIQSGMDGTLVDVDNLVYDFTPYQLMPEFSGIE